MSSDIDPPVLSLAAVTEPIKPPDDDWFAGYPELTEVSSTSETAADRFIAGLVTDSEMERRPPPAYLIGGVIVCESLAVLYGSSGAGKTFVALDWALSVASGSWWQGRPVRQAPVLFVAAEGSGGLGARVAAWKGANRYSGDAGMLIHAEPVNLLDPAAAGVVAEASKRIAAVLVVVDTVARSMPGGDENSAKDIGRLVDNADVIRRASGAAVLLVHHAGKDTSAGMRGNSALHGAVATVIECKGGDGRLELSCRKQKDDAEFDPIHLGLLPYGGSCVLSARPSTGGGEMPAGAVDLLRVLVEIADEDGVSSSVWRNSSAVADRSFYRWQKLLVGAGLTAKTGSRAQARYTPSEQGLCLVGKGEGE